MIDIDALYHGCILRSQGVYSPSLKHGRIQLVGLPVERAYHFSDPRELRPETVSGRVYDVDVEPLLYCSQRLSVCHCGSPALIWCMRVGAMIVAAAFRR